jgi:hypothetical protein
MINPVVVMAISVPNSALSNVKTGVPPRTTSSFDNTPERTGVPEAEATVVPSYTLSLPVIPVMVNSFAVISPESVGCVSV